MFQCEHPDSEYHINDVAGESLKLRIIQDFGNWADAPEFIQLNWENMVLWRGVMKY